jgi:hypothetical protein
MVTAAKKLTKLLSLSTVVLSVTSCNCDSEPPDTRGPSPAADDVVTQEPKFPPPSPLAPTSVPNVPAGDPKSPAP